MTDDINATIAKGFQKEIGMISEKLYASPDECLSALAGITAYFRENVAEKINFGQIPMALKDTIINKLIGISSPIVDYNIDWSVMCSSPFLPVTTASDSKECYVYDKDFNIKVKYRLTIRSSAEDLASQVDEYCSMAVKSLSDPAFNTNITPTFVLKNLVDTYALERGVDEKEESDRIVGRLVKRFFAEEPQPADKCLGHDESTAQLEDSPRLETAVKRVSEWQCLHDMLENFALLQRTIVEAIYRISKKNELRNLSEIAEFTKWFSYQKININIMVKQEEREPGFDPEKREVRIPLPSILYAIDPDVSRIEEHVRKLWNVIREAHSDSILKTDSLALKHDLEGICNMPPQDIGPLLQGVITRNFNVRLIEVHDDADKYATPEYFEVSRANVKKVVTTKPAVVGIDGNIISKGIYLVPLGNSDFTDNNTNSSMI